MVIARWEESVMVGVCEEAAELVARVAALDVGKKELVACVRVPHEDKRGRRRQEVRAFATTTRSLLELRDWLACEQVSLCVMEATSVYWKPPFYLLEDTQIKLSAVISDLFGVSGRDMLEALIAGQRDPYVLARPRYKAQSAPVRRRAGGYRLPTACRPDADPSRRIAD
jgi:hypothetical protein